MFKSCDAPNCNRSSELLPLSPNTIFLVLTSKLPPSCGDVSDTKSVVMFETVVLSAAISTPSTVPDTAMFPVTSSACEGATFPIPTFAPNGFKSISIDPFPVLLEPCK